MILNRGLPAVEVTRLPGGTQIALTLLRSVGWLSRDDLATRRVAAGPLVPTLARSAWAPTASSTPSCRTPETGARRIRSPITTSRRCWSRGRHA